MPIVIDGATATIAYHKSFIAYLKNKIPGALAVHCVIYRQHLVARNLSERLHTSQLYSML